MFNTIICLLSSFLYNLSNVVFYISKFYIVIFIFHLLNLPRYMGNVYRPRIFHLLVTLSDPILFKLYSLIFLRSPPVLLNGRFSFCLVRDPSKILNELVDFYSQLFWGHYHSSNKVIIYCMFNKTSTVSHHVDVLSGRDLRSVAQTKTDTVIIFRHRTSSVN